MVLAATTIVTGLIFLHMCPIMNHEYLQTYGMFASGSMMFLVSKYSVCINASSYAFNRTVEMYIVPACDTNIQIQFIKCDLENVQGR